MKEIPGRFKHVNVSSRAVVTILHVCLDPSYCMFFRYSEYWGVTSIMFIVDFTYALVTLIDARSLFQYKNYRIF